MKRTLEIQDRNGVRVRVTRTPDGTVVEASCACFGHPGRVHNNVRCPLLEKTK